MRTAAPPGLLLPAPAAPAQEQRAGKQCDFTLYPDQTHSISDAQGHVSQLDDGSVVENL